MAIYRVRCDYTVETDCELDIKLELVNTGDWIERHLIIEEIEDS